MTSTAIRGASFRDRIGLAAVVFVVSLAAAACAGDDDLVGGEPFDWALPAGVDPPVDPEDNRTTVPKVELGRRLFFDQRLSADGTYACASCHAPGRAFTDGRALAVGIYGDDLPRGALGLANVGYLRAYTWANPLLTSLEAQALVPMLAKRPAELDLADRLDDVLGRLEADPAIFDLAKRAFPGESGVLGIGNVARALAAYQRTLVSAESPYDRAIGGDAAALSEAARRGRDLFSSSRFGCGGCHSGRWLTDAADPGAADDAPFHNTGLYNIGGTGAYPYDNRGLVEFTGRASDMGRFRTPSLRNVALTAPYMHDGSIATLDQVIDHYAAGGRTLAGGPHAGAGAANPFKDARVSGFEITASERADVIAFLEALTDERFLARVAGDLPR